MFPISLNSMNEQERHNYILQTFVLNKAHSADNRRYKRDIDVIRENHRFLWDEEQTLEDSWEARLAKRYYDKLFKEYCIADLSFYKANKVALRWRTEAEVISGKGQFQCGSRKCEQTEQLRSWEVNFGYQEHGVRKNALIKIRLCEEHSKQLNYRSRKREIKRMKHFERDQRKRIKVKHKKNREAKQHKSNADKSTTEQQHESSVEEALVDDEDAEETVEENTTEDVWSKKLVVEAETVNRETEFERYLEDLLL